VSLPKAIVVYQKSPLTVVSPGISPGVAAAP